MNFDKIIRNYIISQTLIPEVYMSIEEIIVHKGYKVTEHSFPTEDGYILSAFRIFSSTPKGNPVIMIHGFNGAAENFIVNMHTKASAFKLVDEGFDVWVLNTRGNTYSKNHSKLHPNDKEFWD